MTRSSAELKSKKTEPVFSARLLEWYDRHHRDLPWRTSPDHRRHGVVPDPYHVWLSEIMLQQTTVAAVRPYYEKFLRLWPVVDALAGAKNEDVMKAWAGLGYYSRARNLKKCAEAVVSGHGGNFPDDEKALKALPGIGDYTAAAIAAIAFDQPVAVVDGNVERVMARHNAIDTPLPKAKPEIRLAIADHVPVQRSGDFAQAMMDLGATICTPKRPNCLLCPLNESCEAFSSGDIESYPVKAPKKDKPVRKTAAFVAIRPDGSVFLRKRAESGLLGGMTEVPNGGFTSRKDGKLGTDAAPFAGDWQHTGQVQHVFTHFALQIDVYKMVAEASDLAEGWWSPSSDLDGEALPTVMRKALAAAGIELKGRS